MVLKLKISSMELSTFLQFINRTFPLKIRNFDIEPTYWQAFTIVFLIFLLVLTFARVRYLYVHWSLGKQSLSFLFWGFMIALILEGFVIISGRTLLTEVFGWKNAPKPLSTALDAGREKLVDVLGVTDEIPNASAKQSISSESVIEDFESLSSNESVKVINALCNLQN